MSKKLRKIGYLGFLGFLSVLAFLGFSKKFLYFSSFVFFFIFLFTPEGKLSEKTKYIDNLGNTFFLIVGAWTSYLVFFGGDALGVYLKGKNIDLYILGSLLVLGLLLKIYSLISYKKNNVSIKKSLTGFFIFIILIIGFLASSVSFPACCPPPSSKVVEMGISQARTIMKYEKSNQGDYDNLDCQHDDLEDICKDIDKEFQRTKKNPPFLTLRKREDSIDGREPIITKNAETNSTSACIYSPLYKNKKKGEWVWYCADSDGTAHKTKINPGNGYCVEGKSANCPPSSKEQIDKEKNNKKKNDLDKQEKQEEWIRKTKKAPMEASLEGKRTFTFKIKKGVRLIFKEKTEKWKGDIILKKNEKRVTIRENITIFGPGGFSYRIYKTNQPNIIILKGGFMDLGAFSKWKKYLDIGKAEIVALTNISQAKEVKLGKGEDYEHFIKFDMGSCDPNVVEEGKEVKLKNILLNGKPIYHFKEPITLECIDPGGLGPIYSPDPSFGKVFFNKDFSKIKLDEIEIGDLKKEVIIKTSEIN